MSFPFFFVWWKAWRYLKGLPYSFRKSICSRFARTNANVLLLSETMTSFTRYHITSELDRVTHGAWEPANISSVHEYSQGIVVHKESTPLVRISLGLFTRNQLLPVGRRLCRTPRFSPRDLSQRSQSIVFYFLFLSFPLIP